jgi:hypothetical protein
MNTQMCRDIVKEANDGIEALGKEVVQLRAENKELRRLIGLGITYEEPLILTKDMEIKDGSK